MFFMVALCFHEFLGLFLQKNVLQCPDEAQIVATTKGGFPLCTCSQGVVAPR
jgi:hypothetical protein